MKRENTVASGPVNEREYDDSEQRIKEDTKIEIERERKIKKSAIERDRKCTSSENN